MHLQLQVSAIVEQDCMQLKHFHRVDVQHALPAPLLENLESTACIIRLDHVYRVQHALLNITRTVYATGYMTLFVNHAENVITRRVTRAGITTQVVA